MTRQTTIRLTVTLASALMFTGCATAQHQPPVNPASTYVVQRVTRPEGECRAAADSVLAGELAAQAPLPLPGRPSSPPTPPAEERGKTAMVTLYVDRAGRVSKDSIEVRGVTDAGYISALRAMAARFEFVPAVANGCAVPAVVVMPFTYR